MMSGWQVQAMKEAEDARIWEDLNAPDPAEKEMKEAAGNLGQAFEAIQTGLDYLTDAVITLDGYPMADKVQSFLDDIESLAHGLMGLAEHYERGERE